MSVAFGEFDGRFLGVSVEVASVQRWDLIRRYCLGDESIAVSTASAMADPDFLESVSALSLLAHEMRHFHDYLISIHGSRMMQARTTLAHNAAVLIAHLVDDRRRDFDLLPAPLSVWCRMAPDERSDHLRELTAATGQPFRAPRLPVLDAGGEIAALNGSDEETASIVRACAQAQRRLGELDRLPDGVAPSPDFGPMHLWEASGVLVQCQEIGRALDGAAMDRYLDLIVAMPRNRYGAAVQKLLDIFASTGMHTDLTTLLTFACWCLLGDRYDDGGSASPLVRCAMLFRALTEGDGAALADTTEETFELWDAATGVRPTLESLARSLERDESFLEAFADRAGTDVPTGDYSAARDAFALHQQFTRARRHLVERFLADPTAYCSPDRYLASLTELSAPPIKVVLSRRCGLLVDEASDAGGWSVYAGREAADGRRFATIVGPPFALIGPQHIERPTAFAAYPSFVLGDLLFGPDIVDVPQSDWDTAAEELEINGIRLVRLIR